MKNTIKKFLFTLIFTISLISIGQTKSEVSIKEDKINHVVSQIDSLKHKFENINQEFRKTTINNDSLRKEIQYYKLKEDYYSAALSDQATRFALIITGLLALLAILSFSIFKLELKRIKKRTDKALEKQSKKFKSFTEKINVLDKDLKHSQGNINASIAVYFTEKEYYYQAVKYHLYAAKYNGLHKQKKVGDKKLKEEEKEKVFETVVNNLILAEDQLKNINKETDKKELKENSKILFTTLNQISKYDYDKIRQKVAEIRVEISNRQN